MARRGWIHPRQRHEPGELLVVLTVQKPRDFERLARFFRIAFIGLVVAALAAAMYRYHAVAPPSLPIALRRLSGA